MVCHGFLNQPIEIDPIEGLTIFSGHKKGCSDIVDCDYTSAVLVRHDIDYPSAGDATDDSHIYAFGGNTTEIGAIEIAPNNTNLYLCSHRI
jgi:hypothetical protein